MASLKRYATVRNGDPWPVTTWCSDSHRTWSLNAIWWTRLVKRWESPVGSLVSHRKRHPATLAFARWNSADVAVGPSSSTTFTRSSRLTKPMSGITEFNMGCPSCGKGLHYGLQTERGQVTHVVWCRNIKCEGCQGDGGSLEKALADLAKNYGNRKGNGKHERVKL